MKLSLREFTLFGKEYKFKPKFTLKKNEYDHGKKLREGW